MHKLNFCGTLCLPKELEGYKARGMNIIYSFNEAHIIPMAGAATPLHILYASKPGYFTKESFNFFLNPNELTKKQIENKTSTLNESILAPDHAMDTDEKANSFFSNRENSLKQIIDNLLSKHNNVSIWINNGIGVDSINGNEGILRDEMNIAYGMILKNEKFDQYQKGLQKSYQNSAHQHIHIAPDTGFGEELIIKLSKQHTKTTKSSLLNYRNEIQKNNEKIPCISICLINKETNLSMPLIFNHFSGIYNKDYSQKMSGLIRQFITNYSKNLGMDFSNKEYKKQQIAATQEFYSSL